MKKFILGPLQQKWVDTLRAHPERQTTGHLGHKEEDGSLKLCCLGQAYLLICENKGVEPNITYHGGLSKFNDNSIIGLESHAEIGLKNASGRIHNSDTHLSNLNDEGVTWPEIADFIEEHAAELFDKSI